MPTPTRDLTSRFIVVTGANTGIGRVTAAALARRGASVVLACRSEPRARPVLETIRTAGGDARFEALDLGDLDSVRACAGRLLAEERPIDVLVNNAGLAGQRGFTKSGFELAFGTNHVGHFLFTMLLAPRLRAATAPRVVNVASDSHYRAKGIDWQAVREPTKSVTGMPEYEVSKLANVLFTRELGRRLGSSGVHTYALHPGVVATEIWRRVPWPVGALMRLFMLSEEEGAKTTLHCAASAEVAGDQGLYYAKCRQKRPSRFALDDALAAELWRRSVEWTGSDL